MRTIFLTVLVVMVLATCACGAGAADSTYWPLTLGNSWTYSIDNASSGHRTGWLSVTRTELVGGQIRYTVLMDESYMPGEQASVICAWTEEGLNIYSVRGTPVDPPMVLVKTSVHTGETWCGNDEDGNTCFEVLSDNASITVPAGTYTGCVQIKQTWDDYPEGMDVFWFKSGIGQVQSASYDNSDFVTPVEVRRLQSYTLGPDISLEAAKSQADGASVSVAAAGVTQASTDSFYIEALDRSAGILVQKTGHGLTVGTLVSVAGAVRTNSDGERYIDASAVSGSGAAQVRPLATTNKTLGGGNWMVSGTAGQIGVTGGAGLNNIGLLVRTTGACTRMDDNAFTIDDGSGVNVRCETPSTITVNPAWGRVAVTGVSSIRRSGSVYERLLKVVWVDVSRPISGEMIYIPAGSFLMGNNGAEPCSNSDELPQHSVQVSGFWIGKYEVTRGEYRAFMTATGSPAPKYWDTVLNLGSGSFTQTDSHPVLGVCYDDAAAYCAWAGGRLPTEAEWEKAARWNGSSSNAYPWGNTWDPEKCNNLSDHNSAGGGYGKRQTSPVGSYPAGASPYGCQDMAGNVWEWCSDWYKSNYYSQTPAGGWIDPQGPADGIGKTIRGGGCLGEVDNGNCETRCAMRDLAYGPNFFSDDFGGFRLARDEVEKISTPGSPTGRQSTAKGLSRTYTATGSTSNYAHKVEYSFDWGDGSSSPWSTSTSASHAWSADGTKTVTVTARCRAHPAVSATSAGLSVNVADPSYSGQMVYVPAGSFLMGNSGVGNDAALGSSNESPQHSVHVSGFHVGKYEVTRGEYRQFIDAGGYSNPTYWSIDGWNWKVLSSRTQPYYWDAAQGWGGYYAQTDSHPVVGVSYYEAEAFCNWAGGHLPTEAQWEKASRWDWAASHPNVYPWGDPWDVEKCNNYYDHNAAGGGYQKSQTAPVGSYVSGASPYGCMDMVGNVEEWCMDWYQQAYYSATPSGGWNDPEGPLGPDGNLSRIVRGGGWSGNDAYYLRCAGRGWWGPGYDYGTDSGFRFACEGLEGVSIPGKPAGSATACVGMSQVYTTTASVNSSGHTLEYSFDWGDGSSSPWSTSTSASYAWSDVGVKTVIVNARCQAHPTVCAASFGFAVTVSNMISGVVTQNTSQTIYQTVESPHNYPNNYNSTWTITGPAGTTSIRVHFTRITCEANYDFVYVKNAAGATQQTYTGNYTGVWSNWVAGDTVKLNLTSDGSGTYYGFRADQYEVQALNVPVEGTTITVTPGSATTITGADGRYLFNGLPAATYTVTPSLSGMTFTPEYRSVTVSGSQSAPGTDFVKN